MTEPTERNIVIIGASSNTESYANQAQQLLMNKGYPVLPVSKRSGTVLGVNTFTDLNNINLPVDTVTLYIGPQNQTDLIPKIIQLKPVRVIFNPGTENPEAYIKLEQAGIVYEEACTLVLLRTRQF